MPDSSAYVWCKVDGINDPNKPGAGAQGYWCAVGVELELGAQNKARMLEVREGVGVC
jgi:hypothetical protein